MTEKTKILVVDDEKIWRNHIEEILAKNGYEMGTADSGDRAIELIENNEFHVIILDMRMESEFRGIEVLEYVKEKSLITPIIILTAYGTVKTATDSMKKGAFDFIEKGEKGASNKEILKKVKDAIHHLFYNSLKEEIVSILKSESEISRYTLFEKVVLRGKQRTELFDTILKDLKNNGEIIEDMDLIKYQVNQDN